ncbi:hypothetical protein J6590_077016 [Homalodisca vitripennis]|nr:hypothetical protein J6590_077016 [Homalodisca vitripennis]
MQSFYSLVKYTQAMISSKVILTIRAQPPNTFAGFMVQARNEKGRPVGLFTQSDNVKPTECFGVPGNTATHVNHQPKTEVTMSWSADPGYAGDRYGRQVNERILGEAEGKTSSSRQDIDLHVVMFCPISKVNTFTGAWSNFMMSIHFYGRRVDEMQCHKYEDASFNIYDMVRWMCKVLHLKHLGSDKTFTPGQWLRATFMFSSPPCTTLELPRPIEVLTLGTANSMLIYPSYNQLEILLSTEGPNVTMAQSKFHFGISILSKLEILRPTEDATLGT